jgi:hypothetical protein
MKCKKSFVPRLESLEDRCCPISWMGGSGNWSDGAHWSGGSVPGTNDFALFPATTGNPYTVSIDDSNATVGGLQCNDSKMTISMSKLLTLQGGGGANGVGNFSMNAGWIKPTSSTANFTLNDIGGSDDHGGGSYWKGGTIGNSALTTYPIMTMTSGSTLTATPTSTITLAMNVQIAGQVLNDSATLNLNNSLTLGANSSLQVGNRGFGTGVLNLSSATLTGGANNKVSLLVYGTCNVDTAGSTTAATTLDFPAIIASGGVLTVESHNTLALTGSDYGADNAVLDDIGTVNLGTMNSSDVANGYAGITLNAGGAGLSAEQGCLVKSTAFLNILGLGNTWDDKGGPTKNDLDVYGTLKLTGSTTGTGAVYRQTTLEVRTGTVTFEASSTFYLEGDGRAAESTVCDNLKTDAGNISVNATAILTPTKVLGTDPCVWEVLDATGGTVTNQFAAIAGWTQDRGPTNVYLKISG